MQNVVADHLSRPIYDVGDKDAIEVRFPDEMIMALQLVKKTLPWFADLANYLAVGYVKKDITPHAKRRLVSEARKYLWDDPFLFQIGLDGTLRRCVPYDEVPNILRMCHEEACGGHFSARETTAKVWQCGFF